MKREIKLISLAVQRKHNLDPRFYVVGGSDIYGFKSEQGSDTDLRGFHMAKSEDFFKLNSPKEQIIINQGGLTVGFEQFPEIELVSHELRKFGKLVSVMNFNVIEWIFCGKPVMNGVRMEMDRLREEIMTHLPGNVPYHYNGMAKQNYYKFLDKRNSECYKPTAKKFLYVLRGLMGAIYVKEHEMIQSDIRLLNIHTAEDPVIGKLIEIKRSTENAVVPKDVEGDARKLIMKLMDDTPKKKEDVPGLDKFIDGWMMDLRGIGKDE